MRGDLIVTVDTTEEMRAVGATIEVEIESVVLGVDGELFQQELRPLLIEHSSVLAAKRSGERKGPLIRIHLAPQEDPNDTDSNSKTDGRSPNG